MQRFRLLTFVVCTVAIGLPVAADPPIVFVSPAGTFQADVIEGKPQPWKPIEIDLIVRGIVNNPNPGPGPEPPKPPVNDPIVVQVAVITKATLKNKEEATAAAMVMDSVGQLNLSPADLKKALGIAAPIADDSLKMGGRLVTWTNQVLVVTTDVPKIVAGAQSAFAATEGAIADGTIKAIHDVVANPEMEATAEAFNFELLIMILRMIMAFLTSSGFGGGAG